MGLTTVTFSFQKFGIVNFHILGHFVSLVSANTNQYNNVLTLHRSGLDDAADDDTLMFAVSPIPVFDIFSISVERISNAVTYPGQTECVALMDTFCSGCLYVT